MVDAITSTQADTRINAGKSTLGDNFETFLTLLTTQLKNQDPLSPVDSNEFTAQITQLAGVEQQLLTNDLLNSLISAQTGAGLNGASSLIGKDATAVWSATELTDGKANWSYELATEAAKVELQVLNSAGKIVWSGAAPDKTEGLHDFTWDGKTTAGGQLEDGGVYSLKVVAKAGNDAAIDSQVLTRGRITGVELYEGVPYLTIGNSILPQSTLIALDEASTLQADEDEDSSLLAKAADAINPFN